MTTADVELYMNEVVDPTIRDFEIDHPASRRHAFIACVVTFHCVDYLAYPKSPGNLRDRFRKRSPDFAIVDRVAHAFKHIETILTQLKTSHLRSPLFSSARRAWPE